jgi:hypothetical protein
MYLTPTNTIRDFFYFLFPAEECVLSWWFQWHCRCLAGHLKGGYPKIPAKAGGYPGRMPNSAEKWRGYLHPGGYPDGAGPSPVLFEK